MNILPISFDCGLDRRDECDDPLESSRGSSIIVRTDVILIKCSLKI